MPTSWNISLTHWCCSLTVYTLWNSNSGFWEKEDGTPFNFWAILTVGWVGFFLSIFFNVVLYKVHPSGVPFSLSHPKKMVVHVLGREYKLRKNSQGNERIFVYKILKINLQRSWGQRERRRWSRRSSWGRGSKRWRGQCWQEKSLLLLLLLWWQRWGGWWNGDGIKSWLIWIQLISKDLRNGC